MNRNRSNPVGLNATGDLATSPGSVSYGVRVRYFETDQMGVVHHAHYPIWFEAARSEYCRVHGVDYAGMERDGMLLPVVEITVRYLAPARYDDDLTVSTQVVDVRRSVLTMRYEVKRNAELLATGQTVQMLVERNTGKTRRFPVEIAQRFLPPEPVLPVESPVTIGMATPDTASSEK